MNERAHVVIVGGGVIGSAIAYFLSACPEFEGRILVLEKDPTYVRAASALSTSGVRQQFSTQLNIELCLFGRDFLREADHHLSIDGQSAGVRLQENGYLYLGGQDAVPAFERNNALQRSLGVDVRLLSPVELRGRFPWLNVEDVAIGSLGLSGEGWTDGYSLMMAFKAKAQAQGAEFRRAEVVRVLQGRSAVVGVRCADGSEIRADYVVNAAGGYGRELARTAGVDLPIRRLRQTVFAFESPFQPEGMPYVLTPDRLFVRPEGRGFIAGIGMKDDPEIDADDFDVDYAVFEEELWPLLAHRAEAFQQVRMRHAWAGHYDLNIFDHNAIVGAAPGVEGFYLANGFSGHGLMQAPGIGRALSELITFGAYRSIDLADMSLSRVAANRPLAERLQY